eukprot:5852757-Prorocentrum_lima.AAC.1
MVEGQLRTSASYVAIGNYWYQWIIHHVLWKLLRDHKIYPVSSGVAGDIMECLFGIAVEEMR